MIRSSKLDDYEDSQFVGLIKDGRDLRLTAIKYQDKNRSF